MPPLIFRWALACCILGVAACTRSQVVLTGVPGRLILDPASAPAVKSVIVTEMMKLQVTARLDRQGTGRLLKLMSHGHAPKVNQLAPGSDAGYVPTSYQAVFATTNGEIAVYFYGRCESCVVGRKALAFDAADARRLGRLLDPNGLWVY